MRWPPLDRHVDDNSLLAQTVEHLIAYAQRYLQHVGHADSADLVAVARLVAPVIDDHLRIGTVDHRPAKPAPYHLGRCDAEVDDYQLAWADLDPSVDRLGIACLDWGGG